MFRLIGNPIVLLFQDYIWAPGLDLMPHWGPLLEPVLLLLILAAILAAIGGIVHFIHCCSYVREVTTPFWKHWSICGAVFAVMSALKPKGGWSIGCHIGFFLLLAFVILLVVKAVSEESFEEHPRWIYALRAGLYGLAFFLLGFCGGLVCYAALLIVIAVAIAGAVCLGAAKGSLAPSPPPRPSASSSSSPTVRLSDGTEIRYDDHRSVWCDTGYAGKEYTRNCDGTFTQTK